MRSGSGWGDPVLRFRAMILAKEWKRVAAYLDESGDGARTNLFL
jgi:hypothetical protein